MAEFTYKELKEARETRNIKRWQMASELGVSEDTIYRWESGQQLPGPDDVGNIERILSCPGLWHKWMLSHYDSYRERYTDMPESNHLAAAVLRSKHEISDVTALFNDLERDAVDGIANDPELWEKFKKEATEAIAALQKAIEKVPNK